MGITGTLSSDQLDSFNSQGYLVIESFANPEDIESMMKRMDKLLDDFDYTTVSQRLTDDYFYQSAENISFFFEEKAFGDDGSLKKPKQLSINKVGHALHELDPVFKGFSSSEKVSGLLFSLGYKKPVIVQSMYIFKLRPDYGKWPYCLLALWFPWILYPYSTRVSYEQPGIGGEVVPHQDNSFLYTEPTSCTGLWLALEDATLLNGCLWAIPGSHKNGLARRFLRGENGVYFDQPSPSYDQKDFVSIEVKAGSLVLIHGDLIHQSFENQSSKSRHAYSLHVVDTNGCKWAPENWIRRKVDPEPLFVAS
ncbi:hypothetical protein DKX38_010395 [Salix brachista]|uniref:Phytanoyl-CoA dioxygenase n=1 Tax=Salix brachista TaxID=2182728 RepID=A0A5N5MD18_9ROSI|nr:hypothetical protein DKX38_010395 [Salix brachista]